MTRPPLLLLVDDDTRVLGLLSVAAHQLGAEILTASNVADALALARSRRPDLITMDGELPDGNGLDATHALRADPETASIPIVMIAGSSSLQEALAAGSIDFLAKPFAITDLVSRLKKWLARKSDATNPGPAG